MHYIVKSSPLTSLRRIILYKPYFSLNLLSLSIGSVDTPIITAFSSLNLLINSLNLVAPLVHPGEPLPSDKNTR